MRLLSLLQPSYLTCLLLKLSGELELHLLQCRGQPLQLVTVLLQSVVERLHLHPHHSLSVFQLLQPVILPEVNHSFSQLMEAVIKWILYLKITFLLRSQVCIHVQYAAA